MRAKAPRKYVQMKEVSTQPRGSETELRYQGSLLRRHPPARERLTAAVVGMLPGSIATTRKDSTHEVAIS
eukprot:3070022-Heterocapsa_arctica.AAC.2